MEFHEKLQELRKKKGCTQEQLAQSLYVSRTAVSKWESGRGFPSIDSLRAIAKYYNVTVDELISSDQALTIAEKNQKQNRDHLLNLVFGLLDVSTVMFLFLPFFKQHNSQSIEAVSLLSLAQISSGIKIAYWVSIISMIVYGIGTLVLQSYNHPLWLNVKYKVSFLLSAISVLLFIVSPQPYVAAFLFIFLLIKLFLSIKKQ